MKNEQKFKKKILEIKSVNPKIYTPFDLDRLMVFALLYLEEKEIPLYFDYIAIVSFKLFPEKFSMVNFEIYPDTNRISKSLRRLADQKRKGLAMGNIRNGFSLTELGRQTAKQIKGFIEGKYDYRNKKEIVGQSRGRSLRGDIDEIKNSSLFKRWTNKDLKDITDYEVLSFLGAIPYTPKRLLLKHLEQLKKIAVNANEKKTLSFLDWMTVLAFRSKKS